MAVGTPRVVRQGNVEVTTTDFSSGKPLSSRLLEIFANARIVKDVTPEQLELSPETKALLKNRPYMTPQQIREDRSYVGMPGECPSYDP